MIHKGGDDVLRLFQGVMFGLFRRPGLPQDFDIVPHVGFDKTEVQRMREDAGGQRANVLNC
jgi:hypothetical protein